ncbi:hypothetical protein B0H14DRAFT_2571607 [Mycena olivaceomarginata]|nr:hypothetical protein B0H14DRAFT_2571607 [Mycena olivaceomarginata]
MEVRHPRLPRRHNILPTKQIPVPRPPGRHRHLYRPFGLLRSYSYFVAADALGCEPAEEEVVHCVVTQLHGRERCGVDLCYCFVCYSKSLSILAAFRARKVFEEQLGLHMHTAKARQGGEIERTGGISQTEAANGKWKITQRGNPDQTANGFNDRTTFVWDVAERERGCRPGGSAKKGAFDAIVVFSHARNASFGVHKKRSEDSQTLEAAPQGLKRPNQVRSAYLRAARIVGTP